MFFLAVVDSVQLTLPGIAGIILSIGMAIDANIIIFERIKDEFKNGKRMSTAIKAGFDKSIKTILDANITTVIAGVVLYILGTGAIKGFAITLLLGVLISMFTSLVITRSFAKLYLYINNKNPKRVGLKAPKGEEAAAVVVAPKTRKLNLGGAK
jgi:protein-export membrane protein SecD